MFGLGASRFPRVSFRTERPFIIGTVITFGIITWLHHSIYQNVKSTGKIISCSMIINTSFRPGSIHSSTQTELILLKQGKLAKGYFFISNKDRKVHLTRGRGIVVCVDGMASAWQRISLGLIVSLVALIAALYLHNSQQPNDQIITFKDSTYWTTLVGIEKGLPFHELLPPLRSGRLIGLRIVQATNEIFARELGVELPEEIDRVLVAVYSQDPHLNWGRNHLLHQGPLSSFVVHLVFPSLQLGQSVYLQEIAKVSSLLDEETLLILKPNIASSLDIVTMVKERLGEIGMTVLWFRSIKLNKEQAEKFYIEHQGKEFFPDLLEHFISQQILALVVSGPEAIKKVRLLVGPTDPIVAQVEAPNSLRANYGLNKTINSFHASDSFESATREIGFFCHL